jgi:microcystin degradation protein MlrC
VPLRSALRALVARALDPGIRETPSSARPLRIAYGRIAQETNALSPVLTELADFRAMHLIEGEALGAVCGPDRTEAQGFVKNAELSGFVQRVGRIGGVELVPTLSAWAVPGGPLSPDCFETLVGALCSKLRGAGPLDAVFLSLHGSMGVLGDRDPETTLLRRVRETVGNVPIAATLDLHANLTRARLETGVLFFAYHTNPHRDHAARGARAAEVLARTARGAVRPVTAWRSLPMMLGGSPTLDLVAPMRAIYGRCRALEARGGGRGRARPEVLSANVLMCHPWLDMDVVGWSTVVVTDGDRALAERLADELAERCWAVRDRLPATFPSAETAIDRARGARLARKTGVVTLADASDVTTAGAPGDSTALLAALLARGQGLVSYVAVRDPGVARSLHEQPLGARVDVEVGGHLDPTRQRPVRVSGTLAHARDDAGHGKRVRLTIDFAPAEGARSRPGRIELVVTEGPCFNLKPSFWSDLGLRTGRADIVVVKNFFPFLLFYAPYARKVLYVRTGGTTDLDAAYAIPFDGPIHPRDHIEDWRSVDRRRRGVP